MLDNAYIIIVDQFTEEYCSQQFTLFQKKSYNFGFNFYYLNFNGSEYTFV